MARSQFPWEQEALDFIHEQFPAQDNYRAWANFEFLAKGMGPDTTLTLDGGQEKYTFTRVVAAKP